MPRQRKDRYLFTIEDSDSGRVEGSPKGFTQVIASRRPSVKVEGRRQKDFRLICSLIFKVDPGNRI
jgi:hypothetical protein